MMNINEIKSATSLLVSDFNLEGIFPLPLAVIVKKLGYELNLFEPNNKTENISGAIFRDKNLILVNAKDHYLRQRFTIAHEIGHLKLHPSEKEIIDYRRINDSDPKEREADEFAACLLMPEEEFSKKWKLFDGNIASLSGYFGTSEPSVGVRIAKLGLDK